MAMVSSLDTRQQVCLIFFFRGSDFVRLFSKKPNKIATSKNYSKATACRLPEIPLRSVSLSLFFEPQNIVHSEKSENG